jgi:hypothetical protein
MNIFGVQVLRFASEELTMGLRGPKPKGAEYHWLRGNYRPSRHGPRSEVTRDRAAALAAATALTPEQQAERQKEITEMLRRIKG